MKKSPVQFAINPFLHGTFQNPKPQFWVPNLRHSIIFLKIILDLTFCLFFSGQTLELAARGAGFSYEKLLFQTTFWASSTKLKPPPNTNLFSLSLSPQDRIFYLISMIWRKKYQMMNQKNYYVSLQCARPGNHLIRVCHVQTWN